MTLEQLINNMNGGVTCRTCKFRKALNNGYSSHNFQGCTRLPDRRNQWGIKHIKVTNPACSLYRNEKTGDNLEATIELQKQTKK